MAKVPKTIDGLMRHLRNKHKIRVGGSSHKRKLRNIGYYHGYKGYRYISIPSKRIPYTDFNQVLAVYEFDMKLKSILYSQIMLLETAIKNYVLETVLQESKSDSFNYIFLHLLNGYKSCPVGSDTYKKELKKRLKLRDTIYSTLTKNYNMERRVIQHFYHRDANVPIWAIFETISLGEFGAFVSCLDVPTRQQISKSLGLNISCDTNGKLTSSIIYALKDLRNAIAHNDVVFDTRFKSGHIGKALLKCLELSTLVKGISFASIVDYIVLITYLLNSIQINKKEIHRFVSDFETTCENLRKQIPIKLYSQIIPTNTQGKVIALKTFVKNN